MTGRDEVVRALASSLRGPRRARRRLIAEIEEHLTDLAAAETAAGAAAEEAEAAAVRTLGDSTELAGAWNDQHTQHRHRSRRRGASAAIALGLAAAALAWAQHADGGRAQPTPRDRQPITNSDGCVTPSRQAPACTIESRSDR